MDIGRTARSMTGVAGNFPRERNDFYQTPNSASRALFMVEKFAPNFWEPACGDGAICKVAESEFGYAPVGTDLVQRSYGVGGNDFLLQKKLLGPDIVTTPPFGMSMPFLKHALGLGAEKVAFLCRIQFLEGQRRRQYLEKLARVHVFSKRIPRMHNPDYVGKTTTSLLAFAWYVWDRKHAGDPVLKFIVPSDEPVT